MELATVGRRKVSAYLQVVSHLLVVLGHLDHREPWPRCQLSILRPRPDLGELRKDCACLEGP